MTDDEPDKQTYRLKPGIDRVARSGLVLEGDETVEAGPSIERDHGDVLEVDGPADDEEPATADSDDEEETDDA